MNRFTWQDSDVEWTGRARLPLLLRAWIILGTVRHRGSAVEYRVSQHKKAKVRDQSIAAWVKTLNSTK